MNVSFRPHWLLAVALPLVLAACGDSEPDQRAAFKQFLQTRILDKPGVHVPKPTAEESKAFGDYSSHYAVITDFNGKMDESVKPLGNLVKTLSVRSLNDVIEHRNDLQAAKNGLNEMGEHLKQYQAEADAAHAKLKQPDDLKPVYDKAYDRTVSTPTNAFMDVLPQIDTAMDAISKVGDYVEANKAQIQINGSQITVQDPKVLEELNARLQAVNAQGKAVQEAQSRMQSVMFGR
ncbi:DUF3053 domain-containing protein [Pseudomonas sp. RP23018S]|uniref:DUF3053 domain-containing protein n=1 Tax=Pseudomonas sp. RP23018S TaxID=3096037 RepID=UPI002ACADFE9|nr:DUF3053 domain-containing protein [Pseudomonas sp. RP23018S]MDZ5604736.1 DUF3053 domain-containing protein [Pseudomonas sp. RP23018S]